MIIEQIKWGKREYISTNNMIRRYARNMGKSMFIKIRLQDLQENFLN
jgi:hypothetical protein